MYYIRFRDANCFDSIKNILGAKKVDNPLEVIYLMGEVGLINIKGNCYKVSFLEYVPGVKEGAVDCVDVFLDKC